MRGRTQYKKLKRVGRSHYKKRSSRHQFLMSCFIINVGWQVQVLVHYTTIIWMRYVLPPSRYLFLCTLEHKCHEPTFLLVVVFWGNLKILFVCVIAAVHSKSGTFYDIWIEPSYLIFYSLLSFEHESILRNIISKSMILNKIYLALLDSISNYWQTGELHS